MVLTPPGIENGELTRARKEGEKSEGKRREGSEGAGEKGVRRL